MINISNRNIFKLFVMIAVVAMAAVVSAPEAKTKTRKTRGVEGKINNLRDTIAQQSMRIDSLTAELRWMAQRVQALAGVPEGYREERARVVDELTKMRNMYDQEPFDPELVKIASDKFIARKDVNVPHLRVIITDPEIPMRVRSLAITLMGDMGDNSSADIMISMLSRFEEPQLKTDIMIALGKMKETRAIPILEKLRDDPDRGVAFTAAEVHKALSGGDGDTQKKAVEDAPWPLGNDPTENTVPERRIRR